jgi:hypothetical protein
LFLIQFRAEFSDWLTIICLLIFYLAVFIKSFGEYALRQMTVLSALGLLGLLIKFHSAGLCHLSFFGGWDLSLFKALLFVCAVLLFHSKGCFKILVLWVIVVLVACKSRDFYYRNNVFALLIYFTSK